MSRLSIWTCPQRYITDHNATADTTNVSPDYPTDSKYIKPCINPYFYINTPTRQDRSHTMSSSSTSPPNTPSQPKTPPSPSPNVQVTLPTPPFLRRRSQSFGPTTKCPDIAKGSDRPTSLGQVPVELYRAPGRYQSKVDGEGGGDGDGEDNGDMGRLDQVVSPRRPAPRPIHLPGRLTDPLISTSTKALPSSALVSKFASTAVARGLTLSSLSKGSRHSICGPIGGSIWSPGMGPSSSTAAAGWISPALGSAKSLASTTSHGGRKRGLTVAVLKDREMVVTDVPVTPGLVSAGLKSGTILGTTLQPQADDTSPDIQKKESE